MPNQVTLTFAGDTSKVQKSFGEVSQGAERMGKTTSDGFGKAAEGFDTLDTRAMGFRDTLTGVQDGAKGIKQAAAGDWGFETLLLLGFGIGDLASGFVNFLIPALKGTRIATLAQAAAAKASAGATKVWTGAQWLFNASMLANPITWIIIGIVALIAVIVLIATKTDWFQKLWRKSWSWIKSAASNTWDFLKKIPGWIGSAFSKVGNYILAPYRAAFNGIARAWNGTVGRLSWTVPGWVPGIGGNSISVPRLPTFHSGGILPGARGSVVPFLGLAGERVLPMTSSGGGGGGGILVMPDGPIISAVVEAIAAEVRGRGGDPAQLGIRLPRTA